MYGFKVQWWQDVAAHLRRQHRDPSSTPFIVAVAVLYEIAKPFVGYSHLFHKFGGGVEPDLSISRWFYNYGTKNKEAETWLMQNWYEVRHML